MTRAAFISVYLLDQRHQRSPFPADLRSMQVENYAAGEWIAGSGKQSDLIDAITGELIGTTSSGGLDFGQ